MRSNFQIFCFAAIIMLIIGAPAYAEDLHKSLSVCKQVLNNEERLSCLDKILATLETVEEPKEGRGLRVIQNIQDVFGREGLEWEKDIPGPRILLANIQTITRNRSGKFIVTLDNDQVWRQLKADSGNLLIPKGKNAIPVKIRRKSLSSYLLNLGNSKRSIRVKRIK